MSHLRLVPKEAPSKKAAAIERIKRMGNPREELQCPRCGSRTYVTVRNGAQLDSGTLRHGKMLERCICAHCYQRGITQTILPARPSRIK